MKRGSEDYGERRMSHAEHAASSGIFSGWYNSTFRGHSKGPSTAGSEIQESKKGVME